MNTILELKARISDENKAIRDYTHLLTYPLNGSEKRSIRHILNEEKEHHKILTKILRSRKL